MLPALGLVSLYRMALYRIGLKIGHYRRALPVKKYDVGLGPIFHPGAFNGGKPEGSEILLKKAEAILGGELLLFPIGYIVFKASLIGILILSTN